MKTVYIAGPMRGYPEYNFPAFDAARNLALMKGWSAVSPADIDRESGVHESTPPEQVTGPQMARVFAERDLKALLGLRGENGDAIAMLPGWEASRGAKAEFYVAGWLGLTVLDARTMEPFQGGPKTFDGMALLTDTSLIAGFEFRNGVLRQAL